MPDKPPPDHAEDFARRYAQEMDYLTGDPMAELGIPRFTLGLPTDRASDVIRARSASE